MSPLEPATSLRCPRCGRESLRFIPDYPFLTALTMVLGTVGPSEREPDGYGTWVCTSADCRAAISHFAPLFVPPVREESSRPRPDLPLATPGFARPVPRATSDSAEAWKRAGG